MYSIIKGVPSVEVASARSEHGTIEASIRMRSARCGRGLMAVAVLAMVAACGGGSSGSNNSTSTASTTPTTPTTPTPVEDTSATGTGRFVEAWSSGNSALSFALSVVNPKDPTKVFLVDTLQNNDRASVIRVKGGTYDGVSAKVSAFGTRYLVYHKNGGIYRVAMDSPTGAAPVPTRLSNEANLLTLPAGSIVAQSHSGDEALIRYQTNVAGEIKHVRLSMTPTSVPITLGPSSLPAGTTQQIVGWVNDPVTGAISGYLMIDGVRLYRTDANFGNPQQIQGYSNGTFQIPGGLGALAKFRNGFFFVSDGVLRRYDFATAAVRNVSALPNVNALPNIFASGAAADETNFYILYAVGAGYAILRAPDTLDSTGIVVAGNVPATATGGVPSFWQTRDYVLYLNTSGQLVSVSKADGSQVNLGGLSGEWISPSTSSVGGATGNRVFYSKTAAVTGKRVVGSLLADGTDRRELAGASIVGVLGTPITLSAHRTTFEDAAAPFDRILVAVGDITGATDIKGDLTWVNSSTGLSDFVAGTIPANLGTLGAEPVSVFNPRWLATAGTFQFLIKSAAVGALARDAYFLKQFPNSLVRVTNAIN